MILFLFLLIFFPIDFFITARWRLGRISYPEMMMKDQVAFGAASLSMPRA